MSRYKPYPEYKDSGVEWLGKVPDGWNIVKNKQVFKFIKNSVGENSSDYLLLSLTLNGIIPRDIESGKGKFPAEFNTYQEVHKNDLIFCLFDIDETPRTIGLSEYFGMITGAYNVARCNQEIDSKYVYYYYLSIDEYKGLKPFYTGLRKVVRTETFLNIALALPQLKEQQSIVNFLDNATCKIDTLIQKQQNLIELLKEKRQALISHAVTKGLNPHIKMKDSSVEWIGEVPEHWEVKQLKYVKSQNKNSFVDGPFGSNLKSEHFIDDGEVYVIESGFITTGKFIFKDFKTISYQHFETIKRSSCVEGDIVIAKIGANFGMAAELPKLDKESVVSGNSLKITLDNNKLLNQLLIHYLSLAKKIGGFDDIVNTSAQPALSLSGLNNMKLPIPAIQEQQQIINYLDEKTSKIDKLIEKANKTIELLKERRTALISAAVTGKIDVRSVNE